MSDDDLRRALRSAEASALRAVEAPGVDAVHRALRRRRRNRAVLACLLIAGVISGSLVILAARADVRPPPIDRITPSVVPTAPPSEASSPTAQPVAAAPTTASSPPAAQCTRNPIGVWMGDSRNPRVDALDASGPVWPICSGVRLRVMWASYRIDPGTTTGHLYRTGENYLDSGRSTVKPSPQSPPGCSWWVVIASNTVQPPGTLDIAKLYPQTPQSPFWDAARGRDAHIGNSGSGGCPTASATPG